MKVLMRQFLGKNHSWSNVGWGISRELKKKNQVHLFSTDGIQHFPEDLKNNLIGYTEENSPVVIGAHPDNDYDCQISYTRLNNFPYYLRYGSKNRLGIWCFEWAGKNSLPTGSSKYYKFCDTLLAPSNFAKQVFVDSGIPQDVIKVIPHGIDVEQYKGTSTIDLKTNKKFKILSNIAQSHMRKNIPGLLDAYGKAFTSKDDVCLILKAKHKDPKLQFEVSLNECIKAFRYKYPKHAEIRILSDFIDDMSSLYRSIDATFTMTHCEGFYMPGLESIASGKLSIAPNWGGQVDFLDSSNSLLVDGKEGRTDPRSMYWECKSNAIWFNPDVDDAVSKLRYAYNNYETMNENITNNISRIHSEYSWSNVVNNIVNLCR